MQTTDFAGSTDRALALALAADGRLVTAGSATTADNPNFAVARYENGKGPVAAPPPPPPPPRPPAAPCRRPPRRRRYHRRSRRRRTRRPHGRRCQRAARSAWPRLCRRVSCHDEPCVARIDATVGIARRGAAKARNVKLRQVRQPLAAGAKAKVKLPLKAATLRRTIRRALGQGRRVTVRVPANVGDAAGNVATLTYAIRLTR